MSLTTASSLLFLLLTVAHNHVLASLIRSEETVRISNKRECEVRTRTTAGWVCGTKRWADRDCEYASFRGIPYAKQPLGELRFKELEPPEPWKGYYDASVEGPVCPQTDVIYGPLMKPRGMSEACIFANVHVPIEALSGFVPLKETKPCEATANKVKSPAQETNATSSLLPILVFIHGGGFAFGSGDSDVYGPEYLVSKGVIVITFNYRLNVFGFLSLNSTKIPGNNGLRDMITLLRWVRENARYFGGNPDDVTIGGQSAGSSATHLLTLSPEAKGLFKRAILMSGTAIPAFFTTSPLYARFVANALVSGLGINSTDPDEIHRQLVEMPLDKILAVHKALLDKNGVVVFVPVIESPLPGVTPILTEDTEALIGKGYGSDIPFLIGFTDLEMISFTKRLLEIDFLSQAQKNPLLLLSPTVSLSVPKDVALDRATRLASAYFNNGTPTIHEFVRMASDAYFEYPALMTALYRSNIGRAPTFLYQFCYDGYENPIKKALRKIDLSGAGHIEDMTYVFRINSVPVDENVWDDDMRDLMTEYIVNFIKCSDPTPNEVASSSWRAVSKEGVRYQVIQTPLVRYMCELTPRQSKLLTFFNSIMART